MQTSLEEAGKLLSRALTAIPNLTYFGIGIFEAGKVTRELGREAVAQRTAEGQEELKQHLDQIALCADWIKQLKETKTINPRRSSYGYKHIVESWSRRRRENGNDVLDYVSNGCFLAAAVGLGFRFRPKGPNAYFNFSEKSINAAGAQESTPPDGPQQLPQ